MLRKLLKHEFRATGRVILPIFGLLLLSAVGANLSIRGMTNAQSTFLNTLGTILIMLFFLAIIAVGIVALAVMNCTPFVRQYGILSNKWGVLLCQREYRTNDTQRNSRSW